MVLNVEKILEYKSHNNIDYFLVAWNDKTISWSLASNLSCKDLIINFIKSAIESIENKEREIAKKKKEEAENLILEKMLKKNIREACQTETKKMEYIKGLIDMKKEKMHEDNKVNEIMKSYDSYISGTHISNPNNNSNGLFRNNEDLSTSNNNNISTNSTFPTISQIDISANIGNNSKILFEQSYKNKSEDLFPRLPSFNQNINSNSQFKINEEALNEAADFDESNILKNTLSEFRIEKPIPSNNKNTFNILPIKNSEILNENRKKFKSNLDSSKNNKSFKSISNQSTISPYRSINSVVIKVFNNQFYTIYFYIEPNMPVINLDISHGSFINYSKIFFEMFSSYYNGIGWVSYPSVDSEIDNQSLLSSLFFKMSKDNLFFVQKSGEFIWVLAACGSENTIFKHNEGSKFIISKFEVNHPVLSQIASIKSFSQPNTQWVSNNFKLASCISSDYLFRNIDIPIGKDIFIVGDKMKLNHLITFLKNKGEIVNKIVDAKTIIIQSNYLSYVNQVLGFYFALRQEIDVYLLEDFQFKRIFPSGGMITFHDDFINSADLLTICEFFEFVSSKKSWDVRINNRQFEIVKNRIDDIANDNTYISKVTRIYQLFQSKLYTEIYIGNLRDHLESKYNFSSRLFLEVAIVKYEATFVTVEEAYKLVSKF